MNTTPTTPICCPVYIRTLKIKTTLRLHADFIANPRAYVRRHGVDLVGGDVFPVTDLRKKSVKPYSEDLIEKPKANIHLVRHEAICLFTKRDEEAHRVVSIALNPAVLLYEVKRRRLNKGDLLLSLDILRSKVTPLLADPLDARHIVPGLVPAEEKHPAAFWSKVDSEILLPGVQIPCLHNLSHPSTGPAEGAKETRIQLGDKRDPCVIRLKKARWRCAGSNGTEDVEGIRVRLILKGHKLVAGFKPFGTTALFDDTRRLVSFTETSVGLVHQSMMAQLEGDYLPVPSEWKDKSSLKSATHARVLALVSHLTSIPPDDLRAIDKEIRHPSDSTRKRLKEDLQLEMNRLVAVPVSTLFPSSVYAFRSSGATQPADDIDPLIAETYGGT